MPLTQEQMLQKYGPIIQKNGKKYQKSTVVSAKPAMPGETVVTSIGGKAETKNTAKEGDWIVTNPTGESYIVSVDKLQTRYDRISEGQYKAKGKIMGMVASEKDAAECPTFTAAWGEQMILEPGDILAMPIGSNPEIYRIERGVFAQTYEEI